MNGLPGKAIRLFVSCLVSVLILELLVRIFLPQYRPDHAFVFKWSPEGVPLGIPNSVTRLKRNTGDYDVEVRINEHGFRDKKRIEDSTPADLLVVGDSFSMGWGVEEEKRFSDLLEARLHVPVYNIAIPGWIDDYERLLDYAERNGAKFGRLIIGVCMENDIIDYENKPRAPRSSAFQKAKMFLRVNSASYDAVTTVFHGSSALRSLAVKLGWIIPSLDLATRNVYSEKALESSAARLSRLAMRSRTTILLIPSRLLWVAENQDAERRVHDRFKALLEEKGLSVVDLRPIFEAGGNPMQYNFKLDGHWNESGHAKAAEALAGALGR